MWLVDVYIIGLQNAYQILPMKPETETIFKTFAELKLIRSLRNMCETDFLTIQLQNSNISCFYTVTTI